MTDVPKDTSFVALGLSPATLKAIEEAGFEQPTPVQAQAIPPLLAGRDLVARAQTGTGKTAAYGLPLLERVDSESATVQALVLCPTRELAVQISEALYAFGRSRKLRVLPIYGGQPIDRQLRALRAGVHVVVGTPGRTLDHLRRKTLDLTHVRMVVLDEADEMLAMGFIEDIETILAELPPERQTALLSATMPAPIARLAKRYLRDPSRVMIADEGHNTPRIRQSYYEVWPGQKMDALVRILDMETPGPTIVFCGTRRTTGEVAEHLRGRGCLAEGLHGDLNQKDRDRVLQGFREGRVEILVATDVAARGLDIETVTHVINYDIPSDVENYTHRIGRTGRAGREGDAITLAGPRERRQLGFIERALQTRIVLVRLPTDSEIAMRRRELFQQSIADTIEKGEIEPFLAMVRDLTKTHDASAVAAAALKLLWSREQGDIAATPPEVSSGTRVEEGMARLFLTMGRNEGLRPGDLVGAIANEVGLPAQSIGAIDILEHHAFVEVPEARVEEVARALMRTTLRGNKVRVERAPLRATGFEAAAPRGSEGFEAPARRGPKGFDAPTPRGSEGFEAPARRGPKSFEAPAPRGSEGFEAPARRGPKSFEAPAPHGSEGFEAPARRGPKGFDAPAPHGSEGFEAPARRGPKGFDAPAPRGPKGFETPAPHAPKPPHAPKAPHGPKAPHAPAHRGSEKAGAAGDHAGAARRDARTPHVKKFPPRRS